MSITIRIPTVLQSRTGGASAISASGATLHDLFDNMAVDYQELVAALRRDGVQSRFINIYVNGDDVRGLDGLRTVLATGDEVLILPAVAGG